MAILPFLACILLALIFDDRQKDWRSSVLAATVTLGVLTVLSTEILSYFHSINFTSLCGFWVFLNTTLIFISIQRINFKILSINQILNPWKRLEIFDRFLCLITLIVVFITGVTAVFAPPNNWDSMSYVMPRVMHWIQNSSVEHYPTHYTSQLYNSPWSDFTLMHLQVLSGGDWLANIPQWLSMVGSLIGISLIAKILGASPTGQIFSMLVCVTIPVGILHSSNSKNTYVIAFWMVCFVYYALSIIKSRPTWGLVIGVSTSFGLAVLTKGTAYIYALPFIIWLTWSVLLRFRAKTLKYIVVAAILLLSINSGHYFRNIFVFGSPTSTYPYKWENEIHSFPIFISAVLKNISLHLTPAFLNTEYVDGWIVSAHQFLGVNPVDPKLNLFGDHPPKIFTTQSVQLFEDTAGNFFHFWLSVLVVIGVSRRVNLKNNYLLVTYCFVTILSFLIFCFLLKWQIWHSRLHLPFFVLICPVIGIFLSEALNRKASQYILILLIVMASPYVLLNETRSIAATTNIFNTDRITQYFSARLSLQSDYENVANVIHQKSCYDVGLIQRPDAWEYPLLVLSNQNSKKPIRFENVNVNNHSAILTQDPYYQKFNPCLVVSIGLPFSQQVTVHDKTYSSGWRNTDLLEVIQIFLP